MSQRTESAGLLSLGLLLGAITAAVTASGSSSQYAWLEALARALTVVAPISVGVYALRRRPFQHFGAMLVLAGVVWFLTTLTNSQSEVLYSVGRVAAWVVEPLLLYLLLAFPSGRLEHRLDRWLVAAMVLMLLILYLPTALLVERYVVPGPWMSCSSDCPDNAFMVAGSEPAVIDALVRPLRDALLAVLFVAVAVRLAQRIHGSNRLVRHTVTPVLAVACLRCVVYGGGIVLRKFAPESVAFTAWMWLLALMVPVMSLAFLVGLARWWLFITRSTAGLALRLRDHRTPEDLRVALAEAFEDPALEIVYWLEEGDGYWGDADGRPCTSPVPPSGRCLTEVTDGDRLVAGIVHDRALRDERAFVDTATTYTTMTLANQRMSAQTASLLREVRESGARRRGDAPARRGGRASARGTAFADGRHLRRPTRRPGTRGVPAGRCGGQRAADHDLGHRCRALPARDRERRLLLLPRVAAERGQARPRRHRRDHRPPRAIPCASRSATTGRASIGTGSSRAPACATSTTVSPRSEASSRSSPAQAREPA